MINPYPALCQKLRPSIFERYTDIKLLLPAVIRTLMDNLRFTVKPAYVVTSIKGRFLS